MSKACAISGLASISTFFKLDLPSKITSSTLNNGRHHLTWWTPIGTEVDDDKALLSGCFEVVNVKSFRLLTPLHSISILATNW